jgi:hypothetical protein
VVKVYEDAIWPECLAELLPADHFMGAVQKKCEGPKRQILDLDLHAVFPKFARTQLNLERAKSNDVIWFSR